MPGCGILTAQSECSCCRVDCTLHFPTWHQRTHVKACNAAQKQGKLVTRLDTSVLSWVVRRFSHTVTTTRIKSPADCSPAELDSFEALVREGGEVTPAGLSQRISSASRLLFLYDSSGMLCGVSALKHPNDGYRSKVFRQAEASVLPATYPIEIGWVLVSLSHQGQRLSRPLVEQLLPYAEGSLVYGTTRADNERMHRTLARYGFRQDGVPYRSARGDYDLVLFVQHTE